MNMTVQQAFSFYDEVVSSVAMNRKDTFASLAAKRVLESFIQKHDQTMPIPTTQNDEPEGIAPEVNA